MSDYREAVAEGLGAIEWRDDCQGKKDYDGHVAHVSSRYWPRGGGFFTFSTVSGELVGNEMRPEIRPSATSSIVLFDKEIATEDFEADTEEEVKALVEAWVKARVESLSAVLWKWSCDELAATPVQPPSDQVERVAAGVDLG